MLKSSYFLGLLKTPRITPLLYATLSPKVKELDMASSMQTRGVGISTDCHASSTQEVLTHGVDGDIFVISINRPKQRNAVNQSTARKLVEAFKEFDNREELKVAILTGTNGTFCAGYDLKELSAGPHEAIQALEGASFDVESAPMGPSRMSFNKPVIGAISGYAVAGGLELSLLCDMRVVEEDAVMGVFCRRVGVPLIDGGTVRLPRLIGLSRAMDLILTGRAVNASEAYAMGLANRVVPKGEALAKAIELARQIAKFPQQCMRLDRKSAYYSVFNATSMDDALKYEFHNGKKVVASESVSGASAFARGAGRHGSHI